MHRPSLLEGHSASEKPRTSSSPFVDNAHMTEPLTANYSHTNNDKTCISVEEFRQMRFTSGDQETTDSDENEEIICISPVDMRGR
jgi:hypothetical protein